jgi:hypothetical protein
MLAYLLLTGVGSAVGASFSPSSMRTPLSRPLAPLQPVCMVQSDPVREPPPSGATIVAIGAGLCAQPVVAWSLFALKTTGCGLPAGPFGLLGAAEGISDLVVTGFVGAALYKKATTGSGLPAGPLGLLGACEGLSFLSAALGLVVLGFQIADYGYIPEAVPIEGGVCSDLK